MATAYCDGAAAPANTSLARLTDVIAALDPPRPRAWWYRPTIDCDDFATLLALAKAGAGVAVLPLHLAAAELGDGALVRVLPQVTLPGAPLRLVTAPERPLPPRVAVLRDFLVARLPARLGG